MKLLKITLTFIIVIMSFGLFASDTPKLTITQKEALIDSISAKLTDIYVFPKHAEKMVQKLRKNLKKSYKKIDDPRKLAQQLTEDMRSIYNDLHLEIIPMSPESKGQKPDDIDMEKLRIEKMKSQNYGFREAKLLQGNVGYIKLDSFEDVRFAGKTAEAAMGFLINTDALIIDLRENGGGNANMIQYLSSYLFDESQHLNSFYVKEKDEYA